MRHVKGAPEAEKDNARIQESLDMIAPSVIKFEADYFIYDSTYRCVWALKEYPTSTEEQAILERLEEKDGVTLRIYTRHVSAAEERKIINSAANKNRLNQSGTSDLQQTVQIENNLQGVVMIVVGTHRNRGPSLRTAIYVGLTANGYDRLKLLQTEVMTGLTRSKLNVGRFLLRQQQGFQCVMPSRRNVFRGQLKRVLPASSVANLYPFNYSGKTDPHSFYVGRDKFGGNILVDFNQRADDKVNGSILILSNSGQGKSRLLKLILYGLREVELDVIHLDPETEYEKLTSNLGGCPIDLMGSRFLINPLEPKVWDEREGPEDPDAPETFRVRSRISQHISFLKDFFRSCKDFMDREIDVIEIMVQRLHAKRGLTDETDFRRLGSRDYPILSELYEFIEVKYKRVGSGEQQLYTAELLQNVLLGLHSVCRGPEARFLNDHTNITGSGFVTFGVRGVLQASRNLRDALLFNTLSFMSNRLPTVGDTVTGLSEFYPFLSSLTVVEHVRNFTKHMRRKNSSVILVGQDLKNSNTEGIREYAKPLFSIPTHQSLFNAGAVDKEFYTGTLQLKTSEFSLIHYPQHGVCPYRCGNERYNLVVTVPDYRAKLFRRTGRR